MTSVLLNQNNHYDSITGLPSMDSFHKNVKRLMENHEQTNYGILAVHIPHFSKAIQLYGVQQGDYLLSCVVHMFIRKCNYMITACRYEKDTFLILLDISDGETDQVYPALEKCFVGFADYCHMLYPDFTITLQGGISLFRNTSRTAQEIIRQALFVMNQLSQEHSDLTFRLYETSVESIRKMEHVVLPVFENIGENNHLIIYLQPRFHILRSSPAGAEALVRIMDAHGRLLKPVSFLSVLEKNHLTSRLDLIVAERILKLIRQWITEGVTPLSVSVNLSSQSLCDDNFSLIFAQLAAKYPLELSYLEFSLKESFFLTDITALNKLHQLHRLGFHIYLDDFEQDAFTKDNIGSMPIDGIELSHNFLMLAMKHSKYASALKTLLEDLKENHITVVAKGIETSDEEDFIKRYKIDYGQGYYYARPIPFDIFKKKYMSYSFSYTMKGMSFSHVTT